MNVPNARQQAVIDDLDNNIILFASAGTGKTFTVANRICNAIARGKATADEILCLTFTVKACDEIKEDISRYVGVKGKDVCVQTIHGFCFQLIREEDKRTNGRGSFAAVCDEVDEEEVLKNILSSRYYTWEHDKRGNAGEFSEGEFLQKYFRIFGKRGALMGAVSAIKHARAEGDFYSGNEADDNLRALRFLKERKPKTYKSLVEYYEPYGGQVCDEAFEDALLSHAGRWVEEYDETLRRSNLLDFDDLIFLAEKYLRQEEIGTRWAKRYKYIIVDEMQDTSVCEYAVLRRIFANNNVMLCGDYFQTIYEWRGSQPDKVLSAFTKEFNAKRYMFSENYRSTKTLAAATFGYLQNTYAGLIGKCCPEEIEIKSDDEGEKILCVGLDNFTQEAAAIFDYVKRNPPKHGGELCIMARSNKYIANLIKAFSYLNSGLPQEERLAFFTAEENARFYKKTVVKDVLSVLKLALNPSDSVSMERLTEKYVSRVGVKTIDTLHGFLSLGVTVPSFIDPELHKNGDTYASLCQALEEGNVVVYDTETTGLDLNTDEAVQLSAIRINAEGDILATFDCMIVPTVPIGKGALETHGFSLEYIKAAGGVEAKDAYAEFSAFVKGAVLVGHNSARFDSPLVKRQLRDNGLPPLDILAEYDTLVMAKQFHAQLPDYKLSTLCFYYDIVNEAAHNALGDITATAKVLCEMVKRKVLPTAEERRGIFAAHKDKFEKFYAFMEEVRQRIRKGELSDLISFIVGRMMMRKKYPLETDMQAMDRLSALFADSQPKDAEAFLREYLLSASLVGSRMDTAITSGLAVSVITVHQSKGCEFDTVILAGADEEHFPISLAKGTPDEEGERKIFYVAITRAKKRLILTRALGQGKRALKPTPYFYKIPERYVKTRSWENGE